MAWPWDILLEPIQIDQGKWAVIVKQGISTRHVGLEEGGALVEVKSPQAGAKVIASFLETVCSKEFATRQEAFGAATEFRKMAWPWT
jgi:hypothetical protein